MTFTAILQPGAFSCCHFILEGTEVQTLRLHLTAGKLWGSEVIKPRFEMRPKGKK